MTLESLRKYEYGALAQSLVNTDADLAAQALMSLNTSLGDDPATGRVLDQAVYSNPEGMKIAMNVYGGAYNDALEDVTVDELSNDYYNGILAGMTNAADLATIEGEITPFGGETLGSINQKIGDANHVLDGVKKKVGGYTDAQAREARETIKQHENLTLTLSLLGRAKLGSLRPGVEDNLAKENAEGLASKIRGA